MRTFQRAGAAIQPSPVIYRDYSQHAAPYQYIEYKEEKPRIVTTGPYILLP